MVDYYIFHRMMSWIVKLHPEVAEQKPDCRVVTSLDLRDRLAMDYDETFWQELTRHVCLNKLNYRKEMEATVNGQIFWNIILNNN